MKRTAFLAILLFLVLPSAIAADFSAGLFIYNEPASRDVSERSGFSFAEDFGAGVVGTMETSSGFEVLGYVIPDSIGQDVFNVDIAVGAGYSFHLPENMEIDAGLTMVSTLMKAVDGSERLYLTFNGVLFQNLFLLENGQLVILFGVVRPYVSFSWTFLEHYRVSVAHEVNLYHLVDSIFTITASKLLGIGRTALIASYCF